MSRAAYWKIEIARELIASIVPLVESQAQLVQAIPNAPFQSRCAELAGHPVWVSYDVKSTPEKIRGVTTLDIWLPNHGGKVCFIKWDPLEVIRLDRGAWVQELLSLTAGRVLQ